MEEEKDVDTRQENTEKENLMVKVEGSDHTEIPAEELDSKEHCCSINLIPIEDGINLKCMVCGEIFYWDEAAQCYF